MTARYENACVNFSLVCITRSPQISHAPATQATISFARQPSNTIFTRFRLWSSRYCFIGNFHLQALPIQAFFNEGNFMYVLQYLDCKTVRIFAYSSTREQLNKRSGTRLKTEGVWGSRASRTQDSYATLYRFLYWFWEKNRLFCSLCNTWPCNNLPCEKSLHFEWRVKVIHERTRERARAPPFLFACRPCATSYDIPQMRSLLVG